MRNVTCIFALILACSSFAFATGGTVGNGGDTYAIQFTNTARRAHDELKNRGSSLIQLEVFMNTINTAEVESTDQPLYLDGSLKDAINYPDHKKIVFNRKAWQDANERTQLLFVLHEYLGLMGVNDSKYNISSDALKIIAQSSLICRSVLENTKIETELSGRVVLELTGSQEARWSDGLRVYSIYLDATNDHVDFSLYLFEINSEFAYQSINTRLPKSKPEFRIDFKVHTSHQIKGDPVHQVTFECE